MSTAQNRINYTFQKAKDRGVFTGSQEEFMANLKSDPEFADSVVNLTRDSLLEDGVAGAEGLTNEKFFDSIGEPIPTAPEKKKEDGSEKSSADGSAEVDPISQAISSFDEIGNIAQQNIDILNTPQKPIDGPSLEDRAMSSGYNSDAIAKAKAKMEEARRMRDKGPVSVAPEGQNTARTQLQLEFENAQAIYNKELNNAILMQQEALYGDSAKNRYGRYGTGAVDQYSEEIKASDPIGTSNLVQVRNAVRSLDDFIEENGGSEAVLVPYLNNLLGDRNGDKALGFKFSEGWLPNSVSVEYPNGFIPEGRDKKETYFFNSNLQSDLIESVESIVKNRTQGDRIIDIPERVISRQEYDDLIKRNKSLIDNFQLEEDKRQDDFRGEMIQMNEQVKALSSEASQIASSIQEGKNNLDIKLSSINENKQVLEEMSVRLSDMYDIFSSAGGFSEADIREYENLRLEYQALFDDQEKQIEEYNSMLEALNKRNQEFSAKAITLSGLQEQIQQKSSRFQEDSDKRIFDMSVTSYEMNRLIRGYSDNVLKDTWTWYGLVGKSIVNGVEDVASGLLQVSSLVGAGLLEMARIAESTPARILGLDSAANIIDSKYQAIDEAVFGDNVDFSEDGWLSASLSRSQSASTFIEGLSDMWGPTTKEAIQDWASEGLGMGIEGALRSLPAMLGGSFSPVLFFASSMDSSLSQMSDARFDGMSDANKLLVATSIATAEAMLERLGMPESLKRSPFFRDAVKRTVMGLGDDITSASFRNAMINELKSIPKTMLVNAAEEFITGGSQQASQMLIQDLSDIINGENFFVNPETVSGFFNEVIKSGTAEAFGSLLFGAIGEISTSLSTKRVSDAVFEPLVNALASGDPSGLRSQREQQLQIQLKANKIDQETIDREMADFDRLVAIINNLPKDDNGGVAANKVQIRTLVELEMKKALLSEQNTASSQKKLAEVEQQIEIIQSEAERTHRILNVQEESASQVVYNSSQEGNVTVENLTEQENADLNQVISELKSEGENDTQVVIHLNEKSAREAGLEDGVGGRYDGNILHVNLKAIERNKIYESKAGFSKLKGFSETLREELNHSLMTNDILSAKIDVVRSIKNEWIGLIGNDRALYSRVSAKEEVYRQSFLQNTPEGIEYLKTKEGELTSADYDAIENKLSESKKDELERLLADEVVQEIASFASSGRIEASSLEKVIASVAKNLPSALRNGALDKIGKSRIASRQKTRQTFEESLLALKKGGVYEKIEDGMKKRDSKGINPAALPTNNSFTVRIQYPGISTRVNGQGKKFDKTFNGKWDFVNYIRKLTKDGTVPFFNFELISDSGNKPIDGYKISGWNFKNSFKPLSPHEAKITLSNSIREVVKSASEGNVNIGFDKNEFDKAASELRYPLPFETFIKDFIMLDLLVSSGKIEPKMPTKKRKGEVVGEHKKALYDSASFAISVVRENLDDIQYIPVSMSAVDKFHMSDIAKMKYPEAFGNDDIVESVIRNSSRLTPATSKSNIDFFNPIFSLPTRTQYELMKLEDSVSQYRENKGWKIHPFEYLSVAITEKSRDENGRIKLQSDKETANNLVDIAWAVSNLAEKNKKPDPSRQFDDYQISRDAYMSELSQDSRMPKNIQSFSPIFDMIVAITSNGEMEEVSINRAQEMFEVMMALYNSEGLLPSDGMSFVKSFEKNTDQKLSSQRRNTMAFQISNMSILASEFILKDGSFDTDRFISFATQKTEVREDFRRLHLRLSGGQGKSLKDSTGNKIPNFALNLMGASDVLTIDSHVHRTVSASSGDLLTHGTLAAAAEKELFSKPSRLKAVGILDAAVSRMKKEGLTQLSIASEIKDAMKNLGFSGEKVVPYVKNGDVVIDKDGRIMTLSVDDYLKGNFNNAKADKRSNVDAFMVAFVADLMNLDSSKKEATDFMYSRVGIKRSNEELFSDSNINKANRLLNVAHQQYNAYLKSQGKPEISLAGFGQIFFTFGKINGSRRNRNEDFPYVSISEKMSKRDPMSIPSTLNTFDEVVSRMTEDANEVNSTGVVSNNTSAIVNFSKRDGDFFAEGYVDYGQIKVANGESVFSQSGYVDGKFKPNYNAVLDTSSLKGARVYPSPFSEGSLVDGSLRTIKSAESVVYVKKNGYYEVYVNGELKVSNTHLSDGEFDRWRDGKGGEIEVEGFRQKLQQETQQKVTKEQAEAIYKRTNIPFRQTFWKSGEAESYYKSGVRNSSRLRKPAEKAAKSHEFRSVKEEILKNPENYISKQNIKEAKEKLAEMSHDDLVAIMTDDALGRLQNRNDDLGVLAAAELIQRKVDSGDVQGVPALIEELGKMGTTAGRLLRHFREMKRSTPQGLYSIINGMVERRGNKLTESQSNRLRAITEALMYHQNRLKDLMERAIKGENVDDEIKQAKADLERAESELNNLVNKVVEKGWGEIGVSIMQGNLLTPMSQFTNVGANLANALIKIPVDLLAAPIDRLAEVFGMNVERKHRVSLGAYMYGLRRFGDGFVEAIDQIITGKEEAGTEWRVNRGFMPIRSFMAAWANNDLPLGADGKASASQRAKLFVQGTLGIPAEVMFRFLSLGDTPFRRMVEGFELYQVGINKGLEGESLKRFVKYPNRDDLAYAEREGRKLTFQEETTASRAAEDAVSFFERLFARGFDWMPGVDGRAFGKFFVRANMPYVRTPANILYDTLTFVTPYVAIPRILGSIAKGDTHAASENLAKLIIGTTTMQVAAKMISLGLISGAVEWDEDEEKNIAYDQFPPNSINVSALRRWIDSGDSSKQEDDFFIGYNKLGVVGAIIGATVKSTTRDEARKEDPFSANKMLRDAFGINAFGSIAYMMDQSFLQGMNNLISVISSSDADDFERQFEMWFSSMFQATSSIILPNSMAAYHRAEREYMPDTRITKDMTLSDRLIKRMEYTIRDRVGSNNMPVKVNWKGEPITQTPRGTSGFAYQFFDIMKTRQGESDDVSQEIWRLYEETEELSSIVGTPYYATTRKVSVPKMVDRSKKEREAFDRTGKTYTFLNDPDFTESSIYLSVEEINKAMELSGKERYALARQLMSTREYMSEMSNSERIEALNKIDDKFSGLKEIDENGNFRSHTLYLLDVMEQKYLEMKENE